MFIDDFFKQLVAGWKPMLCSLITWLVFGGLFLAIYPAQYEASATLKIGSVLDGSPIETLPVVAARFRNPFVLRTTLSKLGLPSTDSSVEQLRTSIRVQPIDDRSVQMTLRWPDRSKALEIIQQLGDGLISDHAASIAQATSQIREQLSQETKLLGDVGAEAAQDAYAANRNSLPTQQGKSTNPDRLTVRQVGYREQLLPPNTVPTVFEFPADVSEEPVFPKPLMVYLLALVLGLACGVIWIFGRSPRAATVA